MLRLVILDAISPIMTSLQCKAVWLVPDTSVTNRRPRYQAEPGDRPEITCALAPHYRVTVVSPIANTYSNG